jgi:hypothetical protein
LFIFLIFYVITIYKMSLVVLSSSQDVYEKVANTDNGRIRIANSFQGAGLQLPWSFRNFINPTIKIPPNSEVALQSVKFRRANVFQVLNDMVFGWYYGEPITQRLRAGGGDLTIEDMTSSIIPITILKGTYSNVDFSDMLGNQLALRFTHPDWFQSFWVSDYDESDAGYYFETKTQGSQLLVDTKDELITATAWLGNTNHFNYHPATGVLTRTIDTEPNYAVNGKCIAILEDLPLSLTQGRFEVNVASAPAGWSVGLTRPTISGEGPGQGVRSQPSYHTNGIFYDYEVRWEYDPTMTENVIKLFHSVWQDYAEGTVMEEIQYYGWTTLTDFTPNLDPANNAMARADYWNASAVFGTPVSVQYIISGEHIEIRLVDSNALNWTILNTALFVDTNNSVTVHYPVKGRVTKPTSMATWTMYPKLAIHTLGENLTLGFYSGIKPIAEGTDGLIPYSYPQTAVSSGIGIRTPGSSVWGRAALEGRGMIRIMRQLEARSWNNMTNGVARSRNYVGLDNTDNAPNYHNVLVVKPGSPYQSDDDYAARAYSGLDDVSEYLGLPLNESELEQGSYGYTSLFSDTLYPPVDAPLELSRWLFYSTQAPIGSSQSVFVRTPSLTAKSYNMGKSIPSQIIYHCPKFDNQGNSSGDMYFEPGEKTYICLDNAEELNINDMLIELVDKNERLSTDLSGSTIVVLHFRQKNGHTLR